MGKMGVYTYLTQKMKEVADEGTPDVTGKLVSS